MNIKKDLLKQRDEITNKINEIEEKEKEVKILENNNKLKILRDNKELILSLIKHDRTSCSDDNISNGFESYSSGGYKCVKCALSEILDDEFNNEYEVYIDASISRI